MNDEPVRIEVTLPRPLAEVWPAFRDPELIRRWFGWEYDEGGGLDGEITHIFVDGTVVEEDGTTLHVGGHRFTFEDAGTQTIVRVTRATPLADGGADPFDWDAWYDDIDEGWLSFLQQLRFALAHHWGDDRRTLQLGGEPTTADAPPFVADVTGLADAAARPVGGRYAAVVAGETLEGEVWFRSEHQLGVTVDSWGPGLLILAEAPNAPIGHGARTATLTTYGADDPERTGRWQELWASHHRTGD